MGGRCAGIFMSCCTKFTAPSTRLNGSALLECCDRLLDLTLKPCRGAETVRLLEERVVIYHLKRTDEQRCCVIGELYVHRADHGKQPAGAPDDEHRLRGGIDFFLRNDEACGSRLSECFHQSALTEESPPSSPSSAGCPSPATRPGRALRRGPVACRLPTGLASRWRGACGLTPCWGRWKRPFDFPILTPRLGNRPYVRVLPGEERFQYGVRGIILYPTICERVAQVLKRPIAKEQLQEG